MRNFDEWSGAAGALAAGLFTTNQSDTDDDDDDESLDGDDDCGANSSAGAGGTTGDDATAPGGSGVTNGGGGRDAVNAGGAAGEVGAVGASKTRAGRPLEHRLLGSKAAKRQKAEDLSMSRELRASTAALQAIANASKEQSSLMLFNLPEMRSTEEAKLFRKAQARAALAAAGIYSATRDATTTSAFSAATRTEPAVCEIEDDDCEQPPPFSLEAPHLLMARAPPASLPVKTDGPETPVGPARGSVGAQAPGRERSLPPPVAGAGLASDPACSLNTARAPVANPSSGLPTRDAMSQLTKAAAVAQCLNATLPTTISLSVPSDDTLACSHPQLIDGATVSLATDSDRT